MAKKEVKEKGQKEVAVLKKAGLLEVMAAKYNLDQATFLHTLKATVMRPGKDGRVATIEEITAFLVVAQKYGLNPFTNEIHAFRGKNGGIIPIVGVDGFAGQMTSHPDYDGIEIEYSEEELTMNGAKACPKWCEVKIYRKNTARPTVIREYLDEVYVPAATRGGFPGHWQTHTKRALRHKAIIQGARIAFRLTGIYDPDEGQRILEAEAVEEQHLLTMGKPEVKTPEALPPTEETPKQEVNRKEANPEKFPSHEPETGNKATTAQVKLINIQLRKGNVDDGDFRQFLFGIGVEVSKTEGRPSSKDIPAEKVNDVLEWIRKNKK